MYGLFFNISMEDFLGFFCLRFIEMFRQQFLRNRPSPSVHIRRDTTEYYIGLHE
jgi:hypothetical protein